MANGGTSRGKGGVLHFLEAEGDQSSEAISLRACFKEADLRVDI